MRAAHFIYILPLILAFSPGLHAQKLVECGKEWINIHKHNNKLIGVYVQQLPDSIPEHKDYEGKHPVLIIYVFEKGITHTVSFTPSGQIQTGVWGKIEESHWVYKMISKDLNLEKECAYWFNRE